MDELVAENRFDLGVSEPGHEAAAYGNDGVLRVATGGERVRHMGFHDRNLLGHGHVGHVSEPLDRRVQLWLFLRRDDTRPRRHQHQLVRRVVLKRGADQRKNQDERPRDARPEQQSHEDDPQARQHHHRERDAERQPRVPSVVALSHIKPSSVRDRFPVDRSSAKIIAWQRYCRAEAVTRVNLGARAG